MSIENLIVYKMLAGRERDKEDVELILSARYPDINLGEVSQKVKELSGILEIDTHENWAKILNKIKNKSCHP